MEIKASFRVFFFFDCKKGKDHIAETQRGFLESLSLSLFLSLHMPAYGLNRFHPINGASLNSLRCLPCIALLRMRLCRARLAECTSSSPPLASLPPPPSVSTEPAQILFYSIYLFIYSYLFSISEACYQ